MPVEVKMPQMGESITEGTIVKWHKKPGEKVLRDEILFEISTDKVDTEVPSPADGYLRETLVGEGETVPVDTPVCVLSEGPGAAAPVGAAARPQEARRAPRAPTPPSAAAPPRTAPPRAPPGEGIPARPEPLEEPRRRLSPAVRRLVREHQVDLDQIPGTGAGGRVSQKDVLRYLESRDRRPGAPPAAAAPTPVAEEPETLPPLEDRVEPLSVMRQQIAEHMVLSKRTSPHVSTVHEVDMTAVARARRRCRERWAGERLRPTYLPFVVQAVAHGLRKFPVLNSSIEDGKVHYHGEVNIGVAVALESGLIVPVIRRADTLSVRELTRTVEDLALRARSKKLHPDEVRGGTFSITNPGVFGSLIGTPIINQPQSAILCLGAVRKRVVVVSDDDAIGVRSMSFLSLTFDHRSIDGATGDRFLATVTSLLEAGRFRAE